MANFYKPTFEDIKQDRLKQVLVYGDNIRLNILSGVSELRRAAWPTKGRIAANILKGNALPQEIATVEAEIEARGEGETVEELATIHLTKSVALITVDNVIEGMTHKASKAIKATTTPEELEAVVAGFIAQADAKKAEILTAFNA